MSTLKSKERTDPSEDDDEFEEQEVKISVQSIRKSGESCRSDNMDWSLTKKKIIPRGRRAQANLLAPSTDHKNLSSSINSRPSSQNKDVNKDQRNVSIN